MSHGVTHISTLLNVGKRSNTLSLGIGNFHAYGDSSHGIIHNDTLDPEMDMGVSMSMDHTSGFIHAEEH